MENDKINYEFWIIVYEYDPVKERKGEELFRIKRLEEFKPKLEELKLKGCCITSAEKILVPTKYDEDFIKSHEFDKYYPTHFSKVCRISLLNINGKEKYFERLQQLSSKYSVTTTPLTHSTILILNIKIPENGIIKLTKEQWKTIKFYIKNGYKIFATDYIDKELQCDFYYDLSFDKYVHNTKHIIDMNYTNSRVCTQVFRMKEYPKPCQ